MLLTRFYHCITQRDQIDYSKPQDFFLCLFSSVALIKSTVGAGHDSLLYHILLAFVYELGFVFYLRDSVRIMMVLL